MSLLHTARIRVWKALENLNAAIERIHTQVEIGTQLYTDAHLMFSDLDSWDLWRVVTEFVEDVEALCANAPEYLREEWPDLNDTYNKALAIIRKMETPTDSTILSRPRGALDEM